ncbi:MAG: aminoacyl-tRNA hydrolase [Cycloclasticus sp. symbiont of Bathymodiolus heckerae]|nr:MAG: aminoacyl-tRNA hydrolase [Cycloclasticus sp. symbiont of Bathymodiolus heckerae]
MISLIVGLGNPGDEYKKTRHNAGFLLLDALNDGVSGCFSYESRFKAELSKCVIARKTVRLLKPQAYMNKSGLSVSSCAKYFDIPVEEILVVHDELDLESGVVRLKKAGGHGGHNGLKDIVSHLSSKDFYRLRIGVGHPGSRDDVANYVLSAPNKSDAALVGIAIDLAVAEIPEICRGEYQAVMRRMHTEKNL